MSTDPRSPGAGARDAEEPSGPPVAPPDTRRVPSGDLVVVCRSEEDLARRASGYLASLLAATASRRVASAALAGGRTPAQTYRHLAALPLPWDRIVFFLDDERLVRPDHEASNYRMIFEQFAGASPRLLPMVPPSALERGVPPEVLAADYAGYLETLIPRRLNDTPVLDVAVLGVGEDGHIASLFPGSAALTEAHSPVLEVPGPAVAGSAHTAVPRLTLTLPLLNVAARLVFLVSGERKAAALRLALTGRGSGLPVNLLRARAARALWFVDRAAVGDLLP